MHGAIPPLLNMPSWHDAQLKKKQRGNFTCIIPIILVKLSGKPLLLYSYVR
jgi:hypothetical protein